MKCRKCDHDLKDAPVSFDAMSFLEMRKLMYCFNQVCEFYQVVVCINPVV